MVTKLDLHIHSRHSYDSFSRPEDILKAARKRGLDAISITDHDTMAAYRGLEKHTGILVVPGMEVRTDRGDVIGLFLEREVRPGPFADVVREIRAQGGIVVLPHPYRRKHDPEGLAGEADLVEVLNGRSSAGGNAAALALCGRHGKPPVTGSDAHSCLEIGTVLTELDVDRCDPGGLRDALLHGARRCGGRAAPRYLSCGWSALASRIKRAGVMA